MASQQVSGQFRNLDGGNLFDPASNPAGGWTEGASLIDTVTVQPPMTQIWSVTDWIIQFQGFIERSQPASQCFGALGKLIGGLVVGSAVQTGNGVVPWNNPMGALPNNLAGVALMWDGQTDPPFPDNTNDPGPQYPTVFANNLATPINLSVGDQLAIGMWLTSGLTTNIITLIQQASWTVIYDDGQQPVAGWGSG